MGENSVRLLGRLAADPELRKTPGGDSVASFTVAVGFRKKDGTEEADFIDCEVWGGWADNLAASAKKGWSVVVSGRIKKQVWEDAKTKEKRSKVVVRAETVYSFAPHGGKKGEPQPAAEPAAAEALA